MIPSWFFFSFISVLGLIAAELSQRVSMRKVENISAEANNFVVWITISCIGLISALFTKQLDLSKLTINYLPYFILVGSVYFWAGKLFYTSYKGISSAVGATLVTFSVVISTILGIIFFGESASLTKFVGIGLILLAIFTLNYGKNFKLNKYAVLALSGGAIYGVAYTLDKKLVLELNPYTYLFLFALSIATMSIVFKPKIIFKDLISKATSSNFKIMLLAGLCFSIFNLFTFKAYSAGGDVGVIDGINNNSVFGILLLEYIFFNERKAVLKKLLTASIAILGVIILLILN